MGDGGAARLGSAGAKYGTGYCDAQCPHDMKWINNAANCEEWTPSLTDDNAGTGKYGSCCTKDGTNFLEKGGMGAVDTIFQKGGVLVMSLWDDHYANMLWLDSTFPIEATPDMKGAFRGPCDVTSGVPADVEENVPDSKVTFSDIKYGKIGTTIETSSVQV